MKSKLFGVLLLIEAAALLLTAAVALHYQRVSGETDVHCFLLTAALTGAIGMLLYNIGSMNKRSSLQIRDAFMVVALAWMLFSFFGMLPFLMYGTVDNVTDAFFETMSGFSTTGATILDNIDQQPHGILFWRSLMQWLGGLGVVVFTLAFIPSVAKGSKKVSLFAAEAPGLSVEKLAPTMGATSRLLWIIYIFLTLLCAIVYRFGPMDTFDSVCHAMTTIATGGFSTHQASIGYFQSNYVEWVCVLFMLLSGINFAMYHFMFNGRFDIIKRNEELRWYLIAVFGFALVFMVRFYFAPNFSTITDEQLASHPQTWWERIRTSLFHVVALLSNTGFQGSNYDYDLWGRVFLIPTVVLMIVGGCAGSTSGGIKMVRVIVLLKYIKKTVYGMIHSSSVRRPVGEARDVVFLAVHHAVYDQCGVAHGLWHGVRGFRHLFLDLFQQLRTRLGHYGAEWQLRCHPRRCQMAAFIRHDGGPFGDFHRLTAVLSEFLAGGVMPNYLSLV